MAFLRERKRADGSVSYEVHWREPGAKKKSTIGYGADKREAEQAVRLLDANGQSFEAAKHVSDQGKVDGPTVREMLVTHIDQLTNVGEYQESRYRRSVVTHFSGRLGKTKVLAVEHRDIILWIKELQGRGLKPKTIANHHGLLSAAMTTAKRLKIRDDNPCETVKLPKDDAPGDKMRAFTKSEWSRIQANLHPHYLPLFEFMLGTGLRFGEATALEGADFDLRSVTPTVRVSKAWKQDGKNGFFVGPPKTRKSVRTVSLAPSTVEVVRDLVSSAGDGPVFKSIYGHQVLSTTAHKHWGPACIKAGFSDETKPRIHDIRHTHASWMVASGLGIFDLSRRLGHENIATTMDRYSHLLPDAHFNSAQFAALAMGS